MGLGAGNVLALLTSIPRYFALATCLVACYTACNGLQLFKLPLVSFYEET